MPLIQCRECNGQISDKATACPHCGAPLKFAQVLTQPPISRGDKVAAGLVVVVILLGMGWMLWHSTTPEAKEDAQRSAACQKDDLQCIGEKGVVAAGIRCKDPIERLAAHDVKWIDGTFEMKFSRFLWLNQNDGTVTYLGDKAEFQNGFGAFTRVIYECDMDQDGKTVINVRVREGRLPG